MKAWIRIFLLLGLTGFLAVPGIRAEYQWKGSDDQPSSKFQSQDTERDDGSRDEKAEEGSAQFKPDSDDTYEDDQPEKSDQVDSKFKEDLNDADVEVAAADGNDPL